VESFHQFGGNRGESDNSIVAIKQLETDAKPDSQTDFQSLMPKTAFFIAKSNHFKKTLTIKLS
jgi:hypothetical protein